MNTKNANIRFDMDNELHSKAWQLLQGRDKNIYPSYSQAVACALIELLSEDTKYPDNSNNHDELLSEIVKTVKLTAKEAFEHTLPSFLAGYMTCAVRLLPEGSELSYIPTQAITDESNNENAADDIDFDFLGLT